MPFEGQVQRTEHAQSFCHTIIAGVNEQLEFGVEKNKTKTFNSENPPNHKVLL